MRRLAADGRAGGEGGSDAARPAEDEVLGGEKPDVRDQGGEWREGRGTDDLAGARRGDPIEADVDGVYRLECLLEKTREPEAEFDLK